MGVGGAGMGTAVDLRDGLPVDEQEQATMIATLTGNKPTMSVRRGVEMQLRDPDAVEKELEELKLDADAAAPSVVLSPVGAPLDAPDLATSNDDATSPENGSAKINV